MGKPIAPWQPARLAPPKPQPEPATYTKDCYTVDLFTEVKVEKPP